jgi:hypothetical protein
MGRLPFIEWDGAGWEFFRKARAFAILREPATEGDTGNYLPLQTKHKLLLHSFCIHSAFILHSFSLKGRQTESTVFHGKGWCGQVGSLKISQP